MIKAIFIDIDGTLVERGSDVTPRVKQAVSAASQAGVHVVICTGRTRMTAQPILDQVECHDLVILGNGSIVLDRRADETLCFSSLTAEMGLQAVNLAWELGLSPLVFENGMRSHRILFHPDRPPIFHNPERFVGWPTMLKELPFDPLCVCVYDKRELVKPLIPELRRRVPAGAQVIEGGNDLHWGGDIYPAECNKHRGIDLVCERLGINLEETLAIGDNLNDIEMLQRAGVGVAMANANPELMGHADWIAPSVHEDGVAVAIERFVLAGESLEQGKGEI